MKQLFFNRQTQEVKTLEEWNTLLGVDPRKNHQALYDGVYGEENDTDLLEEVFGRYEVDEVLYMKKGEGNYLYGVVFEYVYKEPILLDTIEEVRAFAEEKSWQHVPGVGYEIFYSIYDTFGELVSTHFVSEINVIHPDMKSTKEKEESFTV